jgi:hypothetical protein
MTAVGVVRRRIRRLSPASPRAGNVDVKGQGNTGTLVFGGGVDTRPLIQFMSVPLLKDLPIGGSI